MDVERLNGMSAEDLISKVPSLIPTIDDIKNGKVRIAIIVACVHMQVMWNMQVPECPSYHDFSREA